MHIYGILPIFGTGDRADNTGNYQEISIVADMPSGPRLSNSLAQQLPLQTNHVWEGKRPGMGVCYFREILFWGFSGKIKNLMRVSDKLL